MRIIELPQGGLPYLVELNHTVLASERTLSGAYQAIAAYTGWSVESLQEYVEVQHF